MLKKHITKLHSFFFKKSIGTIEIIEDLKNEVRNATTESHRADLLMDLFNQGFRKEAIEVASEFGYEITHKPLNTTL